jgi:two-component system cell cycle sensor histidine kinase/response regulator CckA
MKATAEICTLLLESLEQTCETIFLTATDGTILYVNPAFEALTGYDRKEVVGKNANILKSGQHSAEFYQEMWGTIRAGKRWSGRLTNRRKDGTFYTEEVRICPICDKDGKPKHFLALRHDIARETQLEEQLNQSQKMESLGLLAGQLSHDFNNLLTVIIGSMELIIEELKPGSIGQKLSTEILRSSKESAGLIKQLMMFARKHDLRPVHASFNEPLGELKVLLDSLLGKGVSVTYALEEKPLKVRMEPEHFKQAVLNLAINAKDAMNGKGKILIKTFNAGPDGLPPSLGRGQYAAFELSDTGPGIPKDILPRIFEPFFTTKPKGKGTGLGLSTVYGVVRQNGGQIFASNRHGGGAVFTIYFPAEN